MMRLVHVLLNHTKILVIVQTKYLHYLHITLLLFYLSCLISRKLSFQVSVLSFRAYNIYRVKEFDCLEVQILLIGTAHSCINFEILSLIKKIHIELILTPIILGNKSVTNFTSEKHFL